MSDAALHDALGELVPNGRDAVGDWDDVLRRAGLAPGTPERMTARRRRRLIPVLAVVAALIALLVTPAFGIGGLLLDLIGRTNVPFRGAEPAPFEVRRDFFDLTLFSPRGMGPEAIVSQARKVGEFRVRGRSHALYVAPTRKGGYCWMFERAFGGCHATRPGRSRYRPRDGAVRPDLLGLSWTGPPIRLTPDRRRIEPTPHTTRVGGDLRTGAAHTVQVEYEDGTTSDVPFVYVSKPIDAGFFLHAIPSGHTRRGTRVRAVRVLDADGRVLARQPISYLTARDFGRRPSPPRNVPPPPRPVRVPAPTPPLQRGEAGGVVVATGRNGVAVFDTTGATPQVEALIDGRSTYVCFSFMRFHQDAPAAMGTWRRTSPRVGIRASGLRTPFDGCEIQAGHGHVWPDRNGSRSAVEVAFTTRAARYFDDRAAARDLALLVRSDEMHRIRKLDGDAFRAAVRQRYGDAVREVRSPGALRRPGRAAYVVRAEGVTFVERSETGRLFRVVITRGKIVRQNVKPLGFVY